MTFIIKCFVNVKLFFDKIVYNVKKDVYNKNMLVWLRGRATDS